MVIHTVEIDGKFVQVVALDDHNTIIKRLDEQCNKMRVLLDHQHALAQNKMYPIMGGPSVPWEVMIPHEQSAQRRHGQSLQRLAERGGLSAGEAWCILNDIVDRRMPSKEQWEEWDCKWREFANRINLHYNELDQLRAKVRELEDR